MKLEQRIKIKKDWYLFLPPNYEQEQLPDRDKWLEALRSGKYKRGTGSLCSLEKKNLHYCCLGVLSKVQNRLVKENGSWRDGINQSSLVIAKNNPVFSIIGSLGHFPANVYMYKFKPNEKLDYNTTTNLADANDDLKLGFKTIAKIIELVWKN